MKKAVIKSICFVAIFVLLFTIAGSVLEKDWTPVEFLPERYTALEKEEQIDIVFIGASNVYADVSPTVIWHETGLTGFNLGTSAVNMMLSYYQLKYVFTKYKPQLVVVDITGMAREINPTNKEASYQKMVSTMPDLKIKWELLRDMMDQWEDVNPVMYLFPLLRYHERWEELTESDFDHSIAAEQYNAFGKGSYTRTKVEKQDFSEGTAIDEDEEGIAENTAYLMKIYQLCLENNAEIMLLRSPNMSVEIAECEQGEKLADENGWKYMFVTSVEEMTGMGIDPEHDFYNDKHLNILGQRKFSGALADFILQNYDLQTHQADASLTEKWNDSYEEYDSFYNENYEEMIKE